MFVIATAGHVDHGKSTLVKALTGMEPDRWEEERRRGLSIGLGFAWTTLPGGSRIAFVDVPGHENFIPTMLAGVGPVPAAMLVVAADEGWMPQSADHLAALDAFGVRHGLLVVTRTDLADPEPARIDALDRLAGTSLHAIGSIAVSARTGQGLEELRRRLAALAATLPPADPDADVRLWVDRCFTVTGAGTVVTGTLGAGTIAVGDELVVGDRPVRVRAVQALGAAVTTVAAVARVAVNLRGVDRDSIHRGDAALTPGAWLSTDLVDVAVRILGDRPLQGQAVAHVGAAAVPALVRPLGDGLARLRLHRPLPLRIGDRLLLRDPGRRVLAGAADVLDIRPPPLRRRGSAAGRARDLQALRQAGDSGRTGEYLRLRRYATGAELRAMGLPAAPRPPLVKDWHVDPAARRELADTATGYVRDWCASHPAASGVPADQLRRHLGLPDPDLLQALLPEAGLAVTAGQVHGADRASALPPELVAALEDILAALRRDPFTPPTPDRLSALGIGPAELARFVRLGRLIRVAPGIVLAADAPHRAATSLAALPQPFSAGQAREALGTTRRVLLPLLGLLDAGRFTRRLSDDTRQLIRVPDPPPVT